jgi:iron complex outermembrane receptor protein
VIGTLTLSTRRTVDYAFTEPVRGYAKYTTGYRAGGFNTQSTPAFFGPGFNAGGRQGLGSRRQIRSAAEAPARESCGLSQQVHRSAGGPAPQSPIFTDTLNAGSATVKGVELESVAVLRQSLRASLFYAWLDGEYGSYVDNGVDYAADRYMQNAPKNQYGLGLEYAFPHTAIGELSLSIDYRKQDESYAN